MSTQFLKDKYGTVIGQMVTRNEEITELREKQGALLGIYNSKYDMTYDKCGAVIGPGNQLLTLL